MFEKLSIPDAKKENLESPKVNNEQRETAEESSLLCTGLMLAALAMPALSGVSEASESISVPNIEYVISNNDLPIMELEQPSSIVANTAAVVSIDGQQKEQSSTSGWVKPVLAIASAIARVFLSANEPEEDEDDDS